LFATGDSIVAIATPPGRGAIGIVRLSGPSSIEIAGAILDHAGPLRARHATCTRIRSADAGVVVPISPTPLLATIPTISIAKIGRIGLRDVSSTVIFQLCLYGPGTVTGSAVPIQSFRNLRESLNFDYLVIVPRLSSTLLGFSGSFAWVPSKPFASRLLRVSRPFRGLP